MIYVQYCVIWYDMPSLSHWTNPSWPWNADLLQSSVCTNLCSSQSLAKWLTLKALDFGEQVSFSCTTSMIFGSTANPTICDPWTEDKTGPIWVTLGFAPFVISLAWYQLLWWFPEIRTKRLTCRMDSEWIFYLLHLARIKLANLCCPIPALHNASSLRWWLLANHEANCTMAWALGCQIQPRFAGDFTICFSISTKTP